MVTRIVKLTFKPEHIDDFIVLFERYKHVIRGAEGCLHLSLLQGTDAPNIFFTYSRWQEALYLEKYRQSSTFSEVWPLTKALFLAPAEAWTLNELPVFDH